MVSQTTVENYCLPSHTSSGRKHKGSEGGLLNLSDTVTILKFLLCLVTSIQRGDTGVAVARCIRMKHPYVKKGTLPLPPESPSMYVCPSLILTVGSLRCCWSTVVARAMMLDEYSYLNWKQSVLK